MIGTAPMEITNPIASLVSIGLVNFGSLESPAPSASERPERPFRTALQRRLWLSRNGPRRIFSHRFRRWLLFDHGTYCPVRDPNPRATYNWSVTSTHVVRLRGN